MALNDTILNLALDYIGTLITYASLHTNAVGSGSGGEVTGGAPAYARKSITWNAAATHTMDDSNTQVFDVPAGTVARLGFWSAVSAGTYYGDAELVDEVFAAQGTYTCTDADITIT